MMATDTLLLRGGRVIDPAQGIDGPNDVLVRDGRIAAVGPGLAAEGATVLDVAGTLILPGLIDGHVHCFHGMGPGLTPDQVGVHRGVTTVVDAGSSGQAAFPLFRDGAMARAKTRVLAYIHLSTLGSIVGPQFANLGDPRLIDPDGIAATFEANRDRIVGIKMHAIRSCVGGPGMEPLRRGRAIADEIGARLMVHVGETWSDEPTLPIAEIVELLHPGDVVTHMYTGQRGGLLDENGRLFPVVRAARDRGVRFDLGHGSSNLNFTVAQRLLDQAFPPDTVSTDGSHRNLAHLVYDLPTVMSKLLAVGVPLEDLVAMGTCRAAELIGRADDLGTLAVGREADVPVLRREEAPWRAVASNRQQLSAQQRLVPVLCVRAGEVIEAREPTGH